ncbi:mitochondrial inner membrane protein OXA1L isoform X3 [Sphaeramia orbicularis]|uniref:mitochondrial inner membrane protein OXA1L isoform X3 n=1 Tax=Sphaeramia orbicularis TaxID=375764 RepID=UPI00117FCEF7|nr:mitochondrial inner membrane protein OXA1L isoform X3 [Sphaeramia orbicularis]
MAAIRSGVTPGCLAKCFLRQSGKPRRGSQHFTEILNPRSVQRSHLHTVLECSHPATRALLGQRHHGKFVWVNAVAVRHNSSQIPPESGSAASPELDTVDSPPVLQSSPVSLPADPAPILTEPIPEQIPVETISAAAHEVDTVPLVLSSSADPAPILMQPISEQIPAETLSAAATEVDTVPLVLDSSADPALNITQPVTEQIPVETVSAVAPEVNTDPAPNITQPISEQIPADTVLAAAPVDAAAIPPVSNPPANLASVDPVLTQPIIEQVANAAPSAAEVLQAASTEPSLAELGLGAFTPVGLIQNLLEFVHLELGLPWWGAIVAGTVAARLLVFPVIVKGQREAAKLNNVLPEMTKLTNRMNEAKQSGNKFEFAKAYTDLNLFQKKHDVNPLRGFLVPMAQAPIFISFFMALRKMSYLPVPSLQTGGVLWFPDLTVADPYYILPLAVTGTMFFILELGAESGIDNPNLRAMKTVFRIMPLVILPLTINFPTAVFTYWLTSNCFSLGQVALLRHPEVRKRLRIPERIQHPASALPQSEGFFASMKKGWKNAQLAQQLEERERRIKNHLDLAAKGPLRQTFTHNPLQQTPPIATASAKGKTDGNKARPWKDTIG